jgi:SAM-dependent methyltransferase
LQAIVALEDVLSLKSPFLHGKTGNLNEKTPEQAHLAYCLWQLNFVNRYIVVRGAAKSMTPDEIKLAVKQRYGEFAETYLSRVSGDGGSDNPAFGRGRYKQSELSSISPNALRLTCGCGNPTGYTDSQPFSSVVDLGCGGGVDVILAARKVGEQGRVFGIDIAPEMIARAKQAVAEEGLHHRRIYFKVADMGEISRLPKSFADVLISNCAINLCPDKINVFKNIFRILRPGGLLVVSDIVFTEKIQTQLRRRLQADWTGCLGGALEEDDLQLILNKLSFDDIQVVRRDHLTMEELETIASYPGKDFVLPPGQNDLLLLNGKVASITINAKRPPLNC